MRQLHGPEARRLLNVPKTFRVRKAIRKIPTRLFCKTGVFVCVSPRHACYKLTETFPRGTIHKPHLFVH